ncbi:MAG: hypothetical protein QM536_01755 [Chitinophagaceae bacterium]|nr:hypothetical protein [Chitinophagaceae bacterium]
MQIENQKLYQENDSLKKQNKEIDILKKEVITLKDKRTKFRIIQGFSGSTIITNDYTLQVREKNELDNNGNKQYEYIITNKNKTNIEVAFPIAVGIMVFDWKKQDLKQTFSSGLLIGTGTTSFLKDFFLGVTQKLDVVQIGFGLNIKQVPTLRHNLKEGDVVQQGLNIPTEDVFKFGFFFSIGIDGEAFSKLYNYIK